MISRFDPKKKGIWSFVSIIHPRKLDRIFIEISMKNNIKLSWCPRVLPSYWCRIFILIHINQPSIIRYTYVNCILNKIITTINFHVDHIHEDVTLLHVGDLFLWIFFNILFINLKLYSNRWTKKNYTLIMHTPGCYWFIYFDWFRFSYSIYKSK